MKKTYFRLALVGMLLTILSAFCTIFLFLRLLVADVFTTEQEDRYTNTIYFFIIFLISFILLLRVTVYVWDRYNDELYNK